MVIHSLFSSAFAKIKNPGLYERKLKIRIIDNKNFFIDYTFSLSIIHVKIFHFQDNRFNNLHKLVFLSMYILVLSVIFLRDKIMFKKIKIFLIICFITVPLNYSYSKNFDLKIDEIRKEIIRDDLNSAINLLKKLKFKMMESKKNRSFVWRYLFKD